MSFYPKDFFRKNLLSAINEITGSPLQEKIYRFTITPVKENNVKYNSPDDIARLWILAEENIKNRILSLDAVVSTLSYSHERYPLWIKIQLAEDTENHILFNLDVSMRCRKPSQLKHTETGHPPFICET